MNRSQKVDSSADELLIAAEVAVAEAQSAWFDSPSIDAAAAYLLAIEALADTRVEIGLEELATQWREVGR